jgi:hypothetical protein
MRLNETWVMERTIDPHRRKPCALTRIVRPIRPSHSHSKSLAELSEA